MNDIELKAELLVEELLQETRYVLGSGEQAFADFYVLEYLYYAVGSGRKEFANVPTNTAIPTHRQTEVVDDMTDICARGLLKALCTEVIRAAQDEVRSNWLYQTKEGYLLLHKLTVGRANEAETDKALSILPFQPSTVTELKHLLKYVVPALTAELELEDTFSMDAENDDLDEFDDHHNADKVYESERLRNNSAYLYLSEDSAKDMLFNSEWSAYYGGKRWQDAMSFAQAALSKADNADLRKVITGVDHIYDMQHNTGHILNKGAWKVSKELLDTRYEAYSITVLTDKASQRVRNLAVALKHLYV